MKYKFRAGAALAGDILSPVLTGVAEGLEGSADVLMDVVVDLNTELPDEKVEALRVAMAAEVSKMLGQPAELELISKEH